MPYPEVYRITDYGGGFSDSAAGGSGVEYYAVSGLGPSEFEAAHALGLPRRGSFSVDNRLEFAGTVQAVDRVAEMPPDLWIARVRYSVGGTFNFGTSLGTRIRGAASYEVQIPVLRAVSYEDQTTFYVLKEGAPTFRRNTFTRVESVRSTVSVDTIQKYLNENIGRVYLRGDSYYFLLGASAVKDAGNNVRVDTEFYSFGRTVSCPAGTYLGQNQAIPALSSTDEKWDWDSSGNIRVVGPPVEEGGPLPWLS